MSRDTAAQRRAELDALAERNGGSVTPRHIVDFARDDATAMHGLFEWDDAIAGEKYREVQAQGYLRAVVQVVARVGAPAITVRAYVSIGAERGDGVYRSIVSVLSDSQLRDALLRDALAELGSVQTKYSHLEELADVWSAIQGTRAIAA